MGALLFRRFSFRVLYREVFVRSPVFRQEDDVGDVHSEQGFKYLQLRQSLYNIRQSRWDYWPNSFGRSNGCSRNDCTSNRKAMLLNKVVVGKGKNDG